MASTPQFVGAPNLGCAKFINSDGTTGKTVFTAGASGSRVLSMVATSDSSSALQFTLTLERSSVGYKIDTFTIPGADLTTPTTNWNMLDPEYLRWLDANEPHLILPSGVMLKVTPVAAVPSGKEVSIFVMGGDF
jgi:hypothetical protein